LGRSHTRVPDPSRRRRPRATGRTGVDVIGTVLTHWMGKAKDSNASSALGPLVNTAAEVLPGWSFGRRDLIGYPAVRRAGPGISRRRRGVLALAFTAVEILVGGFEQGRERPLPGAAD